jgi:cytoskeleton protein RodZ
VSDEESVAGTPGAALAAARETLGLTPAQAAEQLRLTPETILAMEEGRYHVLGAAVFVRGHLRKYAALLGQSAEELLRDYEGSSERATESSLIPPASAYTQVKSEGRRGLRWQPWVAVVAVAVIAAAAWWYWQGRAGQASGTAPVPPPATEQAEAPPPAASPDTQDPAPAAPVEAAPVTAPAGEKTGSSGSGAPAGLSLAFAGPCWLEVYDARGSRLAFELVEPGEQRSFDGPAPWRVVLGNVPVVSARIGGRVVAIPHALVFQNSANVSITASGAVAGNPGPERDS